MLSALKSGLQANHTFQKIWPQYRRRQLHCLYAKRRECYWRQIQQMGLAYNEQETIADIRKRLKDRGYTPARRKVGQVHTFACVPMFSWHERLIPDLKELGPVTHFNYTGLGFSLPELAKADSIAISKRREMTSLILPAFQEAHKKRPVDWVFCYAGGQDITSTVIRQITEEFGVPTVNMSLDDKQGWAGKWMDGCRTGAIDITSAFDLYITSARVSCEWHLLEGGRAVYMPEGFDCTTYHPRCVNPDIPVSFVGVAYGFRPSVLRYLKKCGINVQTFGHGWPGTGHVNDSVEIFNRSVINLGMGGIGYSESLTNVKARDFDIPGTGGGVYLTSFNPDLAQHFVIGKEILCYRNREEMLELIRYYLAHPDEAREIAERGRQRCMCEHRWLNRYTRMLQILGIFR